MTSVNDQTCPKVDLAGAFNKIDIDGSGSISKEELWSCVGGQAGLSKKDFGVLFRTIDSDASGDIDFREYSRFMERVQEMICGKERIKSCMKVLTQRESLDSCERPKANCRRSGLRNSRLQKPFRTNCLDLDSTICTLSTESPVAVRFFDVEVREYEVTVSDHPGVRGGVAALELSWNYNVLERSHLDTFEDQRSTERSKNFMKEKKLTRLEREKILQEFGASRKEIDEAAKRAASVRKARRKSIGMRKHDNLYETIENHLASLQKLFRRKKSVGLGEVGVDVERMHPTLMAMMGIDVDDHDRASHGGPGLA